LYKFIRNIFIWIFILPVKIYQWVISPWLNSGCRHYPTCSQYTIEAFKLHGIFWGLLLGTGRLLRCNPWGTSGLDPVPPKETKGKELWKLIRSRKKYISEETKKFEDYNN
jgi:hypothetical protein